MVDKVWIVVWYLVYEDSDDDDDSDDGYDSFEDFGLSDEEVVVK